MLTAMAGHDATTSPESVPDYQDGHTIRDCEKNGERRPETGDHDHAAVSRHLRRMPLVAAAARWPDRAHVYGSRSDVL